MATQEQADALRAAIASGARTVTVGATSVTYRSVDEMERVLAGIEARLPGAQRVERVFRPVTSTGL